MSDEADRDTRRLTHLDGLRGIAALGVVVHHFVATFWLEGYAFPFPLSNGPFAVFIFFALSGFVLSYSVDRHRLPWVTLTGRRFLRLAIPMLASTWLAWLLLSMWGAGSQRLAEATGNEWLRGFYWGESPLTLWQATLDALLNPFRLGESYSNRVLWTMQVELVGSIVLYAVYCVIGPHHRTAAFAALLLATLALGGKFTSFAPMCAGALLYIAWRNGKFHRNEWGARALIAVGLVCGTLVARNIGETHFAGLAAFLPGDAHAYIWGVGSVAILAGIVMSPMLEAMLASPIPRFLGRQSFALYLVHEPVLMTVVCAAWFIAPPGLALAQSAGLYALIVFTLSMGMTRWLDQPLQAFLRNVAPAYSARSLTVGVAATALIIAAVNARLGWSTWGAIGVASACAAAGAILLTLREGLPRAKAQ